ncbi:hypothetical protein [Haladaptatus salinisoli]|uniref:hypothetical protein n=1 Tax=Haladaptatus salinisoli TaxID=2884876 RepID=UPI001D0B6271|nr:hypothetical protein [Haladaptatus salinisoli]
MSLIPPTAATVLPAVATSQSEPNSANVAIDDTPETPTALLDRAQQHAMNVATEHFPDLLVETIDWEISHRAQRQAGVTKYNLATAEITIALT